MRTLIFIDVIFGTQSMPVTSRSGNCPCKPSPKLRLKNLTSMYSIQRSWCPKNWCHLHRSVKWCSIETWTISLPKPNRLRFVRRILCLESISRTIHCCRGDYFPTWIRSCLALVVLTFTRFLSTNRSALSQIFSAMGTCKLRCPSVMWLRNQILLTMVLYARIHLRGLLPILHVKRVKSCEFDRSPSPTITHKLACFSNR